MNLGVKTFTITSQPYYDPCSQCYLNILMLNYEPEGPLKRFVRRIHLPRLSPFSRVEKRCGLALMSLRVFGLRLDYNENCGDNIFMTPNDIPDLISYLNANGYLIDTQITNMLNQSEVKLTNQKILFTVTYFGTKNPPNITYIR